MPYSSMQASFFDLNNRHIKFDDRDPLIQLNKSIDWEDLSPSLEKIREKPRKNQAGRKLYGVVFSLNC